MMEWLSAFRQAFPVPTPVFVVGWALIGALIGGTAAYVVDWKVAVATKPSEVIKKRPLPPRSRFIRDAIARLTHEIELVSGKQFRDEIIMMPGEQLTPEKPPQPMFALTPTARFTVVKSLHEVTTELAGVEAFLYEENKTLGGRSVVKGYERVNEEYHSLLSMPWVVSADRYVDGAPIDDNDTFRICLYGLRHIDMSVLKRLRDSIDEAEKIIVERVR